ncbi:hypothetical protein ACNR90_002810 [Candidozyma auris]
MMEPSPTPRIVNVDEKGNIVSENNSIISIEENELKKGLRNRHVPVDRLGWSLFYPVPGAGSQQFINDYTDPSIGFALGYNLLCYSSVVVQITTGSVSATGRDGNALHPHLTGGDTGRFLGFWTAVIKAGYSFIMSPELIVACSGEVTNPRRILPKCANQFIYRLAFFYILGSLVIGIIADSNSPRLSSAGTFDAGSRTLYSLALKGLAPKVFTTVNRFALRLRWRKAIVVQGLEDRVPYRTMLQPYGAYYIMFIVETLTLFMFDKNALNFALKASWIPRTKIVEPLTNGRFAGLEGSSESIDSTEDSDINSRLIQHLLDDPTCDGGQFDMFINVAEKYGIGVPSASYPDAY